MSQRGTFTPAYPEGQDLQTFIHNRKRTGLIWSLIFQASTIIAIIALTALLYNIITGAFGYVALQNKVDPNALALAAAEEQMLAAPGTSSSEDDNELVKGISGNPHAIGFFGYAYYQENADQLKILSVEGVEPAAQTAESGRYPLSRPLFIYSAAEVLQDKPLVAAFINYYLSQAGQVIAKVGYFPATTEALNQARQIWLEARAMPNATGLPAVTPADFGADDGLAVAGSSTVYPLTREIAKNFRRDGFAGPIKLDNVGTTAGFRQFCQDAGIDIANASRPITRAELDACRKNRRTPLEFRVGTDALAVVVNRDNDFLQNVTMEELRQIFTSAEKWSEVNPAWPDAPIERFIPGADSGTLDFFAETAFTRDLRDLPQETLVTILQDNVSAGVYRRFESEKPFEQRSREEVYDLVVARVVEPSIVKSWDLIESIFNKKEIVAFVETVPQGELEFRSWLNAAFLANPQSSAPELAGIRTAIFGSLWVIFITILIALPIGVGGAIYLEEYAASVGNPALRRINGIIQTNINNLAGVPSI
ncbi:MAG: substrate-binding domain-containing protein, partial [Chloroflexota bacterium]